MMLLQSGPSCETAHCRGRPLHVRTAVLRAARDHVEWHEAPSQPQVPDHRRDIYENRYGFVDR